MLYLVSLLVGFNVLCFPEVSPSLSGREWRISGNDAVPAGHGSLLGVKAFLDLDLLRL